MRMVHLGDSVRKVFPVDTVLGGRYLDDVFRLVRPDILVEWNRVSQELKVRISHAIVLF